MRKALMFLTSVFLAAGCASMSTSSTSDADAYIRAAEPRFMTAFNAGDAATVASFYADDAVFMQAGQPLARGASAIRDVFAGFMGANKVQLSFTPDRIVQSCDVAYEYGSYTMQITPAGGTAMTDRGNFMTVWRRTANGDWKMVMDTVATAQPMPAMH